MTITSITRDWGPDPSIVRIVTDSSLAEIITGGWLRTQQESIVIANNGPFEWRNGDAVLVQYPTSTINLSTGEQVIGNVLLYVFPSFLSLNPIAPLYPNLQNIIAYAPGGQANAFQLNPGINNVVIAASPNSSVVLPGDVIGQTCVVVNLSANTINIYPAVGDTIDALGTNNPFTLAAGSRVIFIGTNFTKWNSFALGTVS